MSGNSTKAPASGEKVWTKTLRLVLELSEPVLVLLDELRQVLDTPHSVVLVTETNNYIDNKVPSTQSGAD